MTIKRIISALLVVVLGVAFVVPSFALTPAEDSGEVVGIDDVNGDFVPADELEEDGIMSLAATAPSLYDFLVSSGDLPASGIVQSTSDPRWDLFLSHSHERDALIVDVSFTTSSVYLGTLALSFFVDPTISGRQIRLYGILDVTAGSSSIRLGQLLYTWSTSFSVSSYFQRFSLSDWSTYNLAKCFTDSTYTPYLRATTSASVSLPSGLQSPTAIADSIASSPSAVQSLAGALAEAGLGGSDPNEIWTSSLSSHWTLLHNDETGGYVLQQTQSSALDSLVLAVTNSVGYGLTGTLVNVNGIYPTGTHDGPTVSVGSVSTSPLQALLDAIIYSPLTTAKRWVWNGSLEPPTLESTSTITESQAMAENFHSLGVFLNNENTAIKSLISSEVGFGSFDIHEITSDGVVTITHENVGSIVGALSVMSNDITGMLSNLGFVLADPDDVKLKQDTKEETEAATESLYGENGLSKSDNFKQSNDLGSVGGILTPQYDVKDIAGATDNENLWAWFSAETWATAFNVPSVLAEGDEDEPLYQPDSEKWGSAEWKFGDR